jgi:phosphoenolpyruvate carboxykinase (ATP)
VNTGWSGGAFGTGKRMSIQHTRALLAAVLDGSLANAKFHAHPVFGLMMPSGVPGIPDDVLDPRRSWSDKAAYDRTARDLARQFEENFATFRSGVSEDVMASAIRAAA